ncbi:MAG: ABC transporter permease [Clostridium sp.]
MRNKNISYEIIRTVTAITIALLISFIIIFAVSNQPGEAIHIFLTGPFKSMRHFGNVIEMMIPLVFTGLAVSIMFQANEFNLGSEGTFYIGAVAATFIAINITLPAGVHPAVAILFGGLVGAVVGAIPAILKTVFGATELVSSLMLNYICLFFGTYLINNFMRDTSAGSMVSHEFQATAILGKILQPTRLHIGLILAVLAVIFCYLFLYKSKLGYAIRMTGQNPKFAKYSGINTVKVLIMAQIIGGFIAGIGGATEMLGMYTRFGWQQLPGYGWDAIIVAALARNNPILVPISAFFLSFLRVGADMMARGSDVQAEVIAIIQGVMILLIAAERFLAHWKHKKIYKDATKGEK